MVDFNCIPIAEDSTQICKRMNSMFFIPIESSNFVMFHLHSWLIYVVQLFDLQQQRRFAARNLMIVVAGSWPGAAPDMG
jgi:hypothetical protein